MGLKFNLLFLILNIEPKYIVGSAEINEGSVLHHQTHSISFIFVCRGRSQHTIVKIDKEALWTVFERQGPMMIVVNILLIAAVFERYVYHFQIIDLK